MLHIEPPASRLFLYIYKWHPLEYKDAPEAVSGTTYSYKFVKHSDAKKMDRGNCTSIHCLSRIQQ